MKIREYTKKDVESLREIWNQVVEDGVAFPQDEPLSLEEAEEFFAGQSYVGVAEERGESNWPLYPASEQCGEMWAYCKRFLCGKARCARRTYWRKACKRFPG